MEKKPEIVQRAKQSGANSDAEKKPGVWTARMLEHLEANPQGVWFSLIDKVYRKENLREAFEAVKKNGGAAGVDHVNIEEFEKHINSELDKISATLANQTYRPQAVRRVHIPKNDGGKRPLGIPTIRDRTVQGAVRQVLEPIYEKQFKACSYGFRPGIGCKDALREVQRLLDEGNLVVLDADIKGFFDNIDHEILIELVSKRVADGRVLVLIEQFLQQEIQEAGKGLQEPKHGTPQGGVISPLLANVYLHELDVAMSNHYQIIRYADDSVVLCKTVAEAEAALTALRETLSALKLELHPNKTRIVNMQGDGEQFEFLGYRFKSKDGKTKRYPRDKSVDKLKSRIRQLTPRRSGRSLKEVIARVNMSTKGWFEYFKHSSKYAFEAIDKFIRRRLRAMLARFNKRRAGRMAVGQGLAHYKWLNSFFTEHELFNLTAAHAEARRQSARR